MTVPIRDLSMPRAHAASGCRSLSVVIPAFNEEERLGRTVRAVHDFLNQRSYDAEILVVNDGSRDETLARATRLAVELHGVRVLGLTQNRGKGFATRAGVLESTRDAVLFMDADLSVPISDIDRLWPWFDAGYDVVIGSRRAPGADLVVRQPLHRRILGRVFHPIVSLLGVRGIRDTQCGFKLFRREAARKLFQKLRTDGFAFDVEILMEARRCGLPIREVGVRWTNSPDSRVRPLRDSARMLAEVLRMRTR